MKRKPLYFKGTKGIVKLTQWFDRMETMFHISNCTVENQIKFATCTLLRSALTWWNAHVRTIGHDVAYAMTWTNLKKMMTDKYFPRGEIKKLEVEMWNLKVKGTDMNSLIAATSASFITMASALNLGALQVIVLNIEETKMIPKMNVTEVRGLAFAFKEEVKPNPRP
ncbi:reverse transcriptase domain-containing protein [Tanacetum coccineum]